MIVVLKHNPNPEQLQSLITWLQEKGIIIHTSIGEGNMLLGLVGDTSKIDADLISALDFMVLIARSVFVPGLVFWGGTLLRSRLHFPRPYEQPGFTPLVAKESRGHSMPSRHALSAAVLAAVWLYFYPAAGCVMVGIALLICCLRVLTGVHHVRDVVCGFALGFALGCAGMWLL